MGGLYSSVISCMAVVRRTINLLGGGGGFLVSVLALEPHTHLDCAGGQGTKSKVIRTNAPRVVFRRFWIVDGIGEKKRAFIVYTYI